MRSKIASVSFSIWLLSMAISVVAQPAVLDSIGEPLQSGNEYHIVVGASQTARLSLISRNNTCPLYVGEESVMPIATMQFPTLMLQPYAIGETIIRETRDLTVRFKEATSCTKSAAWRVGEYEPVTKRRFIVTVEDAEADFFSIERSRGGYHFLWCPTETCRACERPRCGHAGIIVHSERKFLVLDGPAQPFRFIKV